MPDKTVRFYTKEDTVKLKAITKLPKNERKAAVAAFCAETNRTPVAVNVKLYSLEGRIGSRGAKRGPYKSKAVTNEATTHGPIQVSKSSINIPLRGVEITSDTEGKLWLKANY